MMDLDFRQGDQKSAIEMLKQGRHIIVTQEFHELKGLNVGDKIPLKTPKHGTVDYTIAGVVWSPGIDVIASMYRHGPAIRPAHGGEHVRVAGRCARRFRRRWRLPLRRESRPGIDKEVVMQQVKDAVGAFGMRAGDVRHIKASIEQGFSRLLLLVSTVAFAAMAVASLGVTNTIMA